MNSTLLFSILLGSGIGLASSVLNFWLLKKGIEQDVRKFLAFLMGAMAFRLFSISIIFILVISFVPIQKVPFSLSLLIMVFIGIGIDSVFALKQTKRTTA
jgi:hypothetical protein